MNAAPPMILFAEDDPDDRMLLEEACEGDPTPYRIRFVDDGEVLLETLHQLAAARDAELPRLVILDLNMPRMDGREALAAIRADAALRHLPVIVLTTSNAPVDISRCYELGASSFIIKPSSFAQLVATMRAISHYWIRVVQAPLGDSIR